MIDLRPAAHRVATLVTSVSDGQLVLATPCGLTVGQLVDHLGVFSQRFVAVARNETTSDDSPPSEPDADHLEEGWRERIAVDLGKVAAAWLDPRAWEGTTSAGGMEMPGEVAGNVAIDELIVHGWDLATATSQPYEPTTQEIAAARSFVESFADVPRTGELFGPVVDVADDAPPLDQLLGLTGRDPAWRPH